MDMTKDYTGKIIKVHYLYGKDNKEYTQTGIVMGQEKGSSYPRLTLLLTNGNTWSNTSYTKVQKITSARLPEDLRTALTNYYKAKVAQTEFLNKFQKEIYMHERNVSKALETVREFSGTLSFNEFCDEVKKLFDETYPHLIRRDHWNGIYFECNSVGPDSVTVSHTKDIEKYATPEKYSILYREYDDTMHLRHGDPDYKRFCERNAPAVIPSLDKRVKTEVHASVGDKNRLTVHRTYTFPLKDGMTKQSVAAIKELLQGPEKKVSLEDKIRAADAKKTQAAGLSRVKETKKER